MWRGDASCNREGNCIVRRKIQLIVNLTRKKKYKNGTCLINGGEVNGFVAADVFGGLILKGLQGGIIMMVKKYLRN